MNSLEPNSQKANRFSLLTDLESAAPLPYDFYLAKTPEVAKRLLGKGLFVKSKDGVIVVEIVETEAYLGSEDPASHAYRGPTKRSWPMFERGGTCYVYLSYGLNYCMNVTSREIGRGEAVLLRAAAPVWGDARMLRHRGMKAIEPRLLNGPGKMTQALGIDLAFNGLTYDLETFKLIDLGRQFKPSQIGRSTRIGITKAADELLRFYVKGSPWLSRKG